MCFLATTQWLGCVGPNFRRPTGLYTSGSERRAVDFAHLKKSPAEALGEVEGSDTSTVKDTPCDFEKAMIRVTDPFPLVQ